jgi:predicted esterase
MELDCTRRQWLGVAALAGLAACRPPASAATAERFQVRHNGHDVRCLYHASTPTTVPPLVVVLLHGAGADASQWVDIGMVAAVDAVAVGHRTPLVTVAPDLNADADVPTLVLDALVPAAESRFAPHRALAISGISRGAGQALQTMMAAPGWFSSLGLHSPAITSPVDTTRIRVPVLIDAGDRDPLAPGAHRLADALGRAGVPVTTMWPPGAHDRPYWRAHLRRYLDFHRSTHEATT